MKPSSLGYSLWVQDSRESRVATRWEETRAWPYFIGQGHTEGKADNVTTEEDGLASRTPRTQVSGARKQFGSVHVTYPVDQYVVSQWLHTSCSHTT